MTHRCLVQRTVDGDRSCLLCGRMEYALVRGFDGADFESLRARVRAAPEDTPARAAVATEHRQMRAAVRRVGYLGRNRHRVLAYIGRHSPATDGMVRVGAGVERHVLQNSLNALADRELAVHDGGAWRITDLGRAVLDGFA